MSIKASEIIFSVSFFLSSRFLSLFLLVHQDLCAYRLPKPDVVINGNETLADQMNASHLLW